MAVGREVPLQVHGETASHSSSLMLTSIRSRRMPALLTRMSSRPKVVDRLLDHALGALEVGDVVAVRDGLAADRLDLGDDLLRRRRVGALAGERPAEVVDDDLRARARQRERVPRPIPRPAPVTIATFPSRRAWGYGSYHDGARSVKAVRRGARRGRPVLLIAGLGQGLWAWRYVVGLLSAAVADDRVRRARHRTLAAARGAVLIAAFAEDSAEILAGRRAHVVGLSMGGYVALTLALARPELVRSLVLAGTGAGRP